MTVPPSFSKTTSSARREDHVKTRRLKRIGFDPPSTEAVALALEHAARVPAGALAPRLRKLAPALLARAMTLAPALLGDFGPEVRQLTADRRRALADAWLAVSARFPVHGTYLLKHLPPSEARERAYERWSLAARDRDGEISAAVIAALPTELAAREAARHMDVVALAPYPLRRVQGRARYLAWSAMEAALKDVIGHPEGAMRAVGVTEMIAHPGVYAETPELPDLADRALSLVLARKFEQDPVREAMISTLAKWPRRVWQAAHLPRVAQLVRDALDASDLSVATATAVQRLIIRLFAVDAAWAASWLATTIKERGALYDPHLGGKLTEGELRTAAPQLVAIAKTWTTQERVSWLVAFASGLGPRLVLVDGLAELLAVACRATPWEWSAQQLVEVLARWAPAHYAKLLPDALAIWLKRDWCSAVFAVARLDGVVGRARPRERRRRQPALARPISDALVAIARKLHQTTAPTAIALLRQRDPHAFDRLLPALVAADESVIVVGDVRQWIDRHRQDLLDRYLDGRTIRGQWSTAKSRWVTTFGAGYFRWTPAQVERYAESLEAIVGDDDRDIPAVIQALVTWPQLAWATQDRLCARARDDRPAVREKATRVLARCDAGQGVATLLACLEDDRARFAIYGLRRALFAMPPDRALALLADAPMRKVTVAKEVVRLTGGLRAARAFARLEELASGQQHRDVRIAVLRALWDHLDRAPTWAIFERAVGDPDWVVASRLAALLARLVARPEPEARIGLLARARTLAIRDHQRSLLTAVRARLLSPYDDEVRAAMSAVMARSAEDDLGALGDALRALTRDPRAFHVAATALTGHAIRSRASWRAAAAQLVDAALGDPRWAPVAIRAAAVRAIAVDLVATIERAPLGHDALQAAIHALSELDDRDLGATVAALAVSVRPEVRRVAVAALECDARAERGWTADRLAVLAQLRRDPSPLVAGAAARVWPPRELDPGWR